MAGTVRQQTVFDGAVLSAGTASALLLLDNSGFARFLVLFLLAWLVFLILWELVLVFLRLLVAGQQSWKIGDAAGGDGHDTISSRAEHLVRELK